MVVHDDCAISCCGCGCSPVGGGVGAQQFRPGNGQRFHGVDAEPNEVAAQQRCRHGHQERPSGEVQFLQAGFAVLC